MDGTKTIPHKLQVYVSDDCWSCREIRRIVTDISPQFPEVQVEMLDLENGSQPPHVFAAPTYLLDGRVIFLGNPTREQLRLKLATT